MADATVSIPTIMRSLTIKVIGGREAQMRLSLAAPIFKLAAFIAGCGFEIEVSNTPGGGSISQKPPAS